MYNPTSYAAGSGTGVAAVGRKTTIGSSNPPHGYGSSDLPLLYPERPLSKYANRYSAGSHFPTYGSSAYVTDVTGSKRSFEAAYHPTVIGSHNNIWQSEALYSSNSMPKRHKVEIGSNLPIFPQRPGERDCNSYMLTRTCNFGDACKFNHPFWVPEGGVPGWKESLLPATTERPPERPGKLDFPGYLTMDKSVLPERPTEPTCAFYSKTGRCKFGANCKFNHPKDLQVAINEQDRSITARYGSVEKAPLSLADASIFNSKGLPIRQGEIDCSFYLKTGSCMYGAKCRYNHPDKTLTNPSLVAGIMSAAVPNIASKINAGAYNAAVSFLPNIDLQSIQAALGAVTSIYPQRPGELVCDFYMKTGYCKFGERCKFHHPIDRSAQPAATLKQIPQQTVKFTLAGLPRREGTVVCSFYMKTGTCKFGVNCKFDHPPPGEAIAMARSAKGAGTAK